MEGHVKKLETVIEDSKGGDVDASRLMDDLVFDM